jgi:SAM-dependent methyltransferase
VNRLDDPRLVREEYASESGLRTRQAAYELATGDDPRELAFQAIAEAAPSEVLEVGCGPGELAARVGDELGAAVVAIDLSERMVELARERGVDARVGDAQDLPFEDERFDCVVAAWMLYHVRDLQLTLAELGRVLRPGGRLVAVANHLDHLHELREAIGAPRAFFRSTFNGSNGKASLERHFARVDERDSTGATTFPDREAVAGYARSIGRLADFEPRLEDIDVPLVARRHSVVYVAEKAR